MSSAYSQLNVPMKRTVSRKLIPPTAEETALLSIPGQTSWFEFCDADGRSYARYNATYPLSGADEALLQGQFKVLSRRSVDHILGMKFRGASTHDERPRVMLPSEADTVAAGLTPTGRGFLRIGQPRSVDDFYLDGDGITHLPPLTQTVHNGAVMAYRRTDDRDPSLDVPLETFSANAYSIAWVTRISSNQTGASDGHNVGNCREFTAQAFGVATNNAAGPYRMRIYHQSGAHLLQVINAYTVDQWQFFVLGWDATSQKVRLCRNGVQIGEAVGKTTALSADIGGLVLSLGGIGAYGASKYPSVADYAFVMTFNQNLTADDRAADLAAITAYAMDRFITV